MRKKRKGELSWCDESSFTKQHENPPKPSIHMGSSPLLSVHDEAAREDDELEAGGEVGDASLCGSSTQPTQDAITTNPPGGWNKSEDAQVKSIAQGEV
ncbi:hypothetical protein ABZP36_012177 [Zizania latifolia]